MEIKRLSEHGPLVINLARWWGFTWLGWGFSVTTPHGYMTAAFRDGYARPGCWRITWSPNGTPWAAWWIFGWHYGRFHWFTPKRADA